MNNLDWKTKQTNPLHCMHVITMTAWTGQNHNTHQQAFVFQGSFLCMYQTGWETHTWFCLPSPLQFAQSALTLRCPLIEYGEPWDWVRKRKAKRQSDILDIRYTQKVTVLVFIIQACIQNNYQNRNHWSIPNTYPVPTDSYKGFDGSGDGRIW